ncbi:MAG: XdhC family protein [Myxococcota bacterium]
MKARLLGLLLDARRHKQPAVVVTRLSDGQQGLVVSQQQQQQQSGPEFDFDLSLVRESLRYDRAVLSGEGDDAVFYQPFNPPLRLVVVGAVHIAQPLVSIASTTGYEVVVIDPREAFATAERFPGIRLNHDWPDEALAELELDARCAVVTLTHDPKLDDPALMVALKSAAFYVGALGSKKTHAARVERLQAAGLSPDVIARLRAPVGLPIGARSPAEIAISVMAQITETHRLG